MKRSVWSVIFDSHKSASSLDESQKEAIQHVETHIKDADEQDVKKVLRDLFDAQLTNLHNSSVSIYYILHKAYVMNVIDEIVTKENFDSVFALLKRLQKRWKEVSIYKSTICSCWGTYDICNNQQHYSDNLLKALYALCKTGITGNDAKIALLGAIQHRQQLEIAPGVPRDPELLPMDVRAVMAEHKVSSRHRKIGRKRKAGDEGLVHYQWTKSRQSIDSESDIELGRTAPAELSDDNSMSLCSATSPKHKAVLLSAEEPSPPALNAHAASSPAGDPDDCSGLEGSWNERFACLLSGDMLTSSTIMALIERLIPDSADCYIVDPSEVAKYDPSSSWNHRSAGTTCSQLISRRFKTLAGSTAKVLIPFHHVRRVHWTLFCAEPMQQRWKISHYDSMSSPSNSASIASSESVIDKFLSVGFGPMTYSAANVHHCQVKCAQQAGTVDCGIHVILNAVALVTDRSLPKSIDGRYCRQQLAALLTAERHEEPFLFLEHVFSDHQAPHLDEQAKLVSDLDSFSSDEKLSQRVDFDQADEDDKQESVSFNALDSSTSTPFLDTFDITDLDRLYRERMMGVQAMKKDLEATLTQLDIQLTVFERCKVTMKRQKLVLTERKLGLERLTGTVVSYRQFAASLPSATERDFMVGRARRQFEMDIDDALRKAEDSMTSLKQGVDWQQRELKITIFRLVLRAGRRALLVEKRNRLKQELASWKTQSVYLLRRSQELYFDRTSKLIDEFQ